jgi:hypothetical protein
MSVGLLNLYLLEATRQLGPGTVYHLHRQCDFFFF